MEIFDAERKAKMEGSAFETLIKKEVRFVQAGFKTSLNPTKEFGPRGQNNFDCYWSVTLQMI